LVSVGEASEIADVSRNKTMDLLGERGIPLHYTVEDLKKMSKPYEEFEKVPG
jgi:predicted HTH domain antitoxin